VRRIDGDKASAGRVLPLGCRMTVMIDDASARQRKKLQSIRQT
jgi:hypothetical protein